MIINQVIIDRLKRNLASTYLGDNWVTEGAGIGLPTPRDTGRRSMLANVAASIAGRITGANRAGRHLFSVSRVHIIAKFRSNWLIIAGYTVINK
jgi:hypothetical protein